MRALSPKMVLSVALLALVALLAPAQASALRIDSGPAEGSTVRTSSVEFEYSTDPPTPGFYVGIDDEPPQFIEFAEWQTKGVASFDDLTDGPHKFTVSSWVATGPPGTGYPQTVTRNFTVDTRPQPEADRTPPETTIVSAPPSKVRASRSARVSVGFVSDEAGSTFACSVDGGPASSCSAPAVFKLGKGRHTIAIAATDPAGNTDPSPATLQVKVKKQNRR